MTPGNRFESRSTLMSGGCPDFPASGHPVAASFTIVELRPGSVHRKDRRPIRRGERGGIVKRIDVRLVDHIDLWTDMLVVRLAFQDADGLIDGDATLNDRRVRRRRPHA